MKILSYVYKKIIDCLYAFLKDTDHIPFTRRGSNVEIRDGFVCIGEKNISVGDNVKIGENVYISAPVRPVFIGSNTLIGPGAMIFSQGAQYDIAGEYLDVARVQHPLDKRVYIDSDVKIGAFRVVLCGSRIGKGAVINPFRVVDGEVDAGTVYG